MDSKITLPKTVIVIPTYNERDNIPLLLRRINTTYTSKLKELTELIVIFVDDDSPDHTGEIIQKEGEKTKFQVILKKRKAKKGLGKAYISGFKQALKMEADFVIQMDADLSHEPESLPQIIRTLRNHDFVIGSRYTKGGKLPKWSFLRKMISKGGNFYSRLILGLSIKDYTGGFNGYRQEVLKKLQLEEIQSNGYSFQIEMKYRAKQLGFSFREIPIHFKDRSEGESKFSASIFFEAFVNALKLRLSGNNKNQGK